MARHGSAIVCLLAITAALVAQPPMVGAPLPPPGSGNDGRATLRPTLDPNNRLDALLMKWEQAMVNVESIYVKDCVRTDKDKTGPKVYEGEARYLKPNLAALRMVRKDNPNIYELMVCTGPFLYEFRPEFKKLSIHELDQPKNGTFNSNLLQFLFGGVSAADMKARYDLKLVKDASAENPHYIYLDVLPRFSDDKREFSRAQIVLFAETMLPRRFWFEHPNGAEMLLDLPNFDTSVKLKPADFRPPDAPKGWETIRVPKVEPAGGLQPRIVRPASK